MPDLSVLIVGGGPVGLSAAVLLSRLGVPCRLVEREPGTAKHPQARSLNMRTMEIFRLWGIEQDLVATALPQEWNRQLIYTKTLAGEELGRMRTGGLGCGSTVTPAPYLLSGQDKVEPILRRVAGNFEDTRLDFAVECLEVEIVNGLARAVLRRSDGREERVTARYLIAADGVRSRVRRSLGIQMEGEHNLATSISIHFLADLGRYVNHRPAGLYWVSSSEARGVFQPIDGKTEWLCQIGFTDPYQPTPEGYRLEDAASWIRSAIGDESVELEILNVAPWTMSACTAEHFRSGPVFLAGDSAHQLPITGGFGLNTGVQDVHNLCWKLAYVLDGRAEATLLDSYKTERIPVARYVSERCLENYRAAQSVANAALESEASSGASTPIDTARAVAKTKRYGSWLGMDLGVAYKTGVFISDGTGPPWVDDPVQDYAPTARPGHRAPHVPVVRRGELISLLDLFETRFVLLTGSAGHSWLGAAKALEREFPLDVYRIAGDGDLRDPDDHWLEVYGLNTDGAVLVRPDGHVASRFVNAPKDCFSILRDVRQTLFGNPAN